MFLFQSECEAFRSSRFHCSPVEPGLNLAVNVTDVHFNSSDWTTTDVDMFFNNCQMQSLSISTNGTHASSNLHLSIINCAFSYNQIHSAKGKTENCFSSQETGSEMTPIAATNSTVILQSVHIEKFSDGNFLQIIQSTSYLCNVTFINCGSQLSFLPLIVVRNESFLSVENCIFLSNKNLLIDIKYFSAGLISNSSFWHNKLKWKTACTVSISIGSLLLMNNSHFSNNTILSGVAEVCFGDGSVGMVQKSTFCNNQGRAVYVYNSVGIISKCWFSENTAQWGAALYIFCDRDAQNQTSKTMHKVVWILPQSLQNLVTKTWQFREQSMKTEALPRGQLHNCTFVGNIAKVGGAICAENAFGTLVVQSCNFSKNRANEGGALGLIIKLSGQSTLKISKSFFTKNQALGDSANGGAISQRALVGQWCTLEISSCSFIQNQASIIGGALSAVSYCHVRDSVFHRNSAGITGALSFPSGVITKCSFDSNMASARAGALSLSLSFSGSTFTVSHSNFTNNTAVGGAAIYSLRNASFSCYFCSFHNNRATG